MADDLVGRFELRPGRTMGALSKGQKRQVGLICAVCHRPRLLVLDEPGGGLDPTARRELLEAMVAFLAESGSTVLFSSHLMADIDRMADRLLLIHEGKILVDQPLDAVRENACRVELAGADAVRVADALATSPDCMRACRLDGRVRVALRCRPDQAEARIGGALPGATVEVRGVAGLNLEDLFVEMTGGTACSR
jgi:ABC-2 type transport system ATP-binding protein